MRAPIVAILLLLPATMFAEKVTLRIPEFSEPIRISLTGSLPNGQGFNSITVHANGHLATFHPHNAVACAPSDKEVRKQDITWDHIGGMKLDSSLCFYVGQFGETPARHTVLAFVSEGGASDAAPVLVIGFNADGIPYRILEREELDLTSLITKPDGSALLIGKPTLSQVMANIDYNPEKDPYATTYDPFAVYVIAPGKPAIYSLAQSRTYNIEHYVWAGPKSSESYMVLYNIPGHTKPFVATAHAAETLLAKAKPERKK